MPLLKSLLTVLLALKFCTAMPYYGGGTRSTSNGPDSIIVDAPQSVSSTVPNNDAVYYPAVNLPANCRLRCFQSYSNSYPDQGNRNSASSYPSTRCVIVRTSSYSSPSSSRSTSYSTYSSDNFVRTKQVYYPSNSYSTYSSYDRSAQNYSPDTSYSSYSADGQSRTAQQTYPASTDAQHGSQYESFMVKQDSRMVMGYRAAGSAMTY